VLSGPDELRRAALESALEWHFAHDTQPPPKAQVSIDFHLSEGEAVSGTLMAPPDELARLDRLFIQAPEGMKQKLEGRLPLRVGDRITQSALNDLSAALKDVDEHLRITIHPNADKTGSMIFVTLYHADALAPPGVDSAGAPESPKRIRVGGNVEASNLVQKVQPVYPPDAKANRIQGAVRFTVVIGKDGRVQTVTLVSGDPVLAQAAKEAVQQWIYKPTLLNGDPVEVVTQVDVNFTLSQ
jgi:TonB family protein